MSGRRKVAAFAAVASIAFLASALPLTAARAQAKPPNQISRSVDSGAEAIVSRSTFWTGECQPRGFKLTITKQPSHGKVSVKEGKNTVMANPRFGTAGKCVGKEIMGKQVMNRSDPGFHGEDVVNYEIESDKGEKGETIVTITVK